jgi:hypothetical protein
MRFIVCISKIDLPLPEGIVLDPIDALVQNRESRILEYLTFSGETGEGIDEVVQSVVGNLSVKDDLPWDDPSFGE